ncbi:hypothetical protein YYE_02436 [Plasmodium vinckei vinckei]|nr:hypothetical protein YYE_02436 [Plasmodium vinckei vinckei]
MNSKVSFRSYIILNLPYLFYFLRPYTLSILKCFIKNWYIDCNCDQNQKNVERNSFGIYIRLLYCLFSVASLIGFSCIANGSKGIFYLLFSFCPSFIQEENKETNKIFTYC